MNDSIYHDYAYEMACIQRALRYDRNLKLIVGVLGITASIILLHYVFNKFSWVFAAVSLAFLVGSVRLLYDVIQHWNVNTTKLMRLLHYDTEEIVWVYSVVTQKMPFGIQFSRGSTLYFKLLDKDEITIKIKERDILAISKCLNTLLPHATFGYSKEYEQWYIANPALLLQ